MYAFKPHVFTEHSPHGIAKPEGRMTSRIRCDGKNLYIYNGMNPTASRINELRDFWVYNLAGQQWKLMKIDNNIPDQARIIGTIFDSNYLVICTQHYPLNEEMSCRLHICDLNTESVHVQETSGHIPESSYPLNLIQHGKYFYTVRIGFSWDDEPQSDVYKLNMKSGVWEIVYISRGPDDHEQFLNSGHTLVYGNNMIYIFGGGGNAPALDVYSLEKIWAFDLEKSRWKRIDTHGDENHTPQYPADREGFSVTSYTDPDSGEMNVIISGGADYEYDNDGDGWEGFNKSVIVVFNDVWRLNLTSLKWTCLKRFGTVLPCYVDSHSMTISPAGKLFTFGGYIFNNDMEQGTCSSTLHSTWLRIPKLTDICWEAVFHYYPNLTSMTDEEIIALGIPPKLLKSRIN